MLMEPPSLFQAGNAFYSMDSSKAWLPGAPGGSCSQLWFGTLLGFHPPDFIHCLSRGQDSRLMVGGRGGGRGLNLQSLGLRGTFPVVAALEAAENTPAMKETHALSPLDRSTCCTQKREEAARAPAAASPWRGWAVRHRPPPNRLPGPPWPPGTQQPRLCSSTLTAHLTICSSVQ